MTRRRHRFSFRRPSYRRWAGFWILALAVTIWLQWRGEFSPRLEPGEYGVQRVVDGDTLELTNRWKVRLIGADTPETVWRNHPVEPWGPEATEFTKRFVAGGKIRLQFDGRKIDRYGRHLAHVWVDDRMLGEELVRAGLATAETKYSFSAAMKDRFRQAQAEAKAAHRGIWSR